MAKQQKKKSKGLSEEEILKQIKELSDRSMETSSHQLDLLPAQLGDEDIDLGISPDILKDTADPEESYRLYYGMRRLLIDNLPAGPSNKKLRQMIYDEKNLFLNRGMDINQNGVRGSDGRQTYIQPFLKEAFMAVSNWIANGAIPFDIFMTFRNMNIEKGYYEKGKTDTDTSNE